MKILITLLLMLPLLLMAQETSYICDSGSVTLTAAATGATGITYSWTSPTSATTSGATVSASAAGIWTWTAMSGSCSITGTHEIIIEPMPMVTINAADPCSGQSVVVDATGVPSGYTYVWDFGTGATPATSTSASTSVQWSGSGVKTITLTIEKTLTGTSNGCDDTCSFVYTETVTVGQLSGNSTCN